MSRPNWTQDADGRLRFEPRTVTYPEPREILDPESLAAENAILRAEVKRGD